LKEIDLKQASDNDKQKAKQKTAYYQETSHLGGGSTMTSLALKFPAIRKSFVHLLDAFLSYKLDLADNDNGLDAMKRSESVSKLMSKHSQREMAIPRVQVLKLFNSVDGVGRVFSEEDITELLAAEAPDYQPTNTHVTFKQFMVTIAVGYYLNSVVEQEDADVPDGASVIDTQDINVPITDDAPAVVAEEKKQPGIDVESKQVFEMVKRGFAIVQDTFNTIDEDSSGEVSLDELKSALFTSMQGVTNDNVLEERFKELDLNADGGVDFAEFMFCLVSWVGLDEEEMHERLKEIKKERSSVKLDTLPEE
jgi:hypothetical protein